MLAKEIFVFPGQLIESISSQFINKSLIISKMLNTQTVFAPLCIRQQVSKSMRVNFSDQVVASLRVIHCESQQYLEVSIFGKTTNPFYFHDVFTYQNLEDIFEGRFKNMAEFCIFVFSKQVEYFSLKWPIDDSSNCFFIIQCEYYSKQVRSRFFALEVDRRQKDTETLLAITAQINRFNLKKQQEKLGKTYKKLCQRRKNQQPIIKTYQTGGQVKQRHNPTTLVEDLKLKRKANFQEDVNLSPPKKKLFIATSLNRNMRAEETQSQVLKKYIIIETQENRQQQPEQSFHLIDPNEEAEKMPTMLPLQTSEEVNEVDQVQKDNNKQPQQNTIETVQDIEKYKEKFRNQTKTNQKYLLFPQQSTPPVSLSSSLIKQDSLRTKDTIIHSANSQKIDFSSSEFLSKFSIQPQKNCFLITKLSPELIFQHIHNRYPISKPIQDFKIIPQNIVNHDFTFGILGANALTISRKSWPMDIIAYIGCSFSLVNGISCQKISTTFKKGDLLMAKVNRQRRRISFYKNYWFLAEEKISNEMAKECYIFYETATQGNSVFFMLN